jgi:prepilin-type N-terminal cleavage/methylation domain-containing protein
MMIIKPAKSSMLNTDCVIDKSRCGFSLVEVLIIVAVLGILAAFVMPLYTERVAEAKEAAAKANLSIMRSAIELYTARNDVPPGYLNNDPAQAIGLTTFFFQMVKNKFRYLSSMPQNPFNNLMIIQMIADTEAMPSEATGEFGWIYKPATRDFRIDWPGTDSKGIDFYNY